MNRILVAGCAGFLGSNIVEYLLKDTDNLVFGLDNFSSSDISKLYTILKNDRFHFNDGDAINPVNDTFDTIINVCGSGDLKHYFDDKYSYMLRQVKVVQNLLECAKLSGSKMFSIAPFTAKIPPSDPPAAYYSMVNFILNLHLEYRNIYKTDTKIIRLTDTFGKNMSLNDGRFMPRCTRNALKNLNIELEYDEYSYFTYIDDFLNALGYILHNYTEDTIIPISAKNQYLKSDIIRLIINLTHSSSLINIKGQEILKSSFDISSNLQVQLACNTPIVNAVKAFVENFTLMYFS